MKRSIGSITQLCLTGGLLLSSLALSADAQQVQQAAGVTRISKGPRVLSAAEQQQAKLAAEFADTPGMSPAFTQQMIRALHQPTPAQMRNVSQTESQHGIVQTGAFRFSGECNSCPTCDNECNCKDCRKQRKAWEKACKKACKECEDCDGRGCRWGGYSACDYFRSKFGCLHPTGNGGQGAPWLGYYSRVYPQDVNYFDDRDGQLYSAQGYGVPVAVPLAPVVGHTYNLGWGVPSSRLTPISHLAPR